MVIVAVLSASCASAAACVPGSSDPECPALRYGERLYDEWREFEPPPPPIQELGDAVYPACNDAENCGPDLGGQASTDVWLLEGVDFEQALLGYRQDTETFVIFLRRGVDPDTVAGLPQEPVS